MIYLFYGSDVERVRRKAFAFVEAARAKQPDLVYRRLAREELSTSVLEEVAGSGGLFVSRMLVLLDDPLPAGRQESRDEDEIQNESDEEGSATPNSLIEEHLDALAKSDNVVVVLAPKLLAAKAKKIVAKAMKEYHFDLVPRGAALRERGFNAALVNALAVKDNKKLWLEVVRALEAGDAPEAVHGLLHWKARDVLEKGSRSWRAREARALSLDLITLLMTSRRTSTSLATALERWALTV